MRNIPWDRWDKEYRANATGFLSTRWGVFLDSLSMFDAQAFQISDSEARLIDPQQRMLLETTAEARSICPTDTTSTSATGVYVGVMKVGIGPARPHVPPRCSFAGRIINTPTATDVLQSC